MKAYTDYDVVTAAAAISIGTEAAAGTCLTQAQCAAVRALARRLEEAERLVTVAADVMLSDNFEMRDWFQRQLRNFELQGQGPA